MTDSKPFLAKLKPIVHNTLQWDGFCEMIDFYIGLVDQDCTKELSDDLTIKELKTLKKVDLSEFIDFLEG